MTRMGLSPTATSVRAQSLGSTNQPLGGLPKSAPPLDRRRAMLL